MTVLEMHIAVRQRVDRINSIRNDQLRPEEVDLELNKEMLRFINIRYGRNNIYGKGFEESQKRIDELRNLLVEYTDSVIFKEELVNGRIWTDMFRLPSDYMYLVNQRSSIYLDDCKKMGFTLQPLPNILYFTFRLDQLLVQSGSYLAGIRLQNTVLGTAPTSQATVWEPSSSLLTSGFVPNSFPQANQAVINDILSNPGNGFQIFWQSFGPIDVPGEFIVVVDMNAHPWFEWDASIGTPTPLVSYDTLNNQVFQSAPKIMDRSAMTKRIPTSQTAKITQVLNRFSQQDDIFRLLDDPFNTTNEREPLTTMRDNFIDVYSSAVFMIDQVKITYIRKPLPISLSLGYDCELPEHVHEDIVAMTANAILEGTKDPRYQTHTVETSNKE